MKLSSIDFETLQRAADVADAQRELLERARRQSGNNDGTWKGSRALLAAMLAIALVSLVTLTSFA